MLTTLLFALSIQQPVRVTPLADGLLLIQTARGNLVASVGPDGAAVFGVVDSASTRAVADTLAARTTSPRRWVMSMNGIGAQAGSDGGWDRLGATVLVQEANKPRLGNRAVFSQFYSLVANGEDMHVVHQAPGYSDGDVLVHFEENGVLYLGESYPGDGYPRIDSTQGGTLDGLLRVINPWTRGGNRVVGARGDVARAAEVAAFRDMVVAVRDRVRTMAQAGQTIQQILAARPTAAFDARFGNGVVTAQEFVRAVYRAVR